MKNLAAFAKFLRNRSPAAHGDSTKDSASAEPRRPARDSFPQFGVATDAGRMREVFEKRLRPLDGEDYRVVGCRIFQTRHQQDRLLVQYVLRFARPGTEREHTQEVTGIVYTEGRTREVWEELRRTRPAGGDLAGACPAFAPYSYIPDLDMLVQVFPHDHQLPALPIFMKGLPPELEPLLLARFGPGDWRVEGWNAESVRYLAEMRATLRLTVRARDARTGRTGKRRFYAKIYGDGKTGKQTHGVLRTLWEEAATGGGANFTVAEPIAYLGGLRTLVQEEVTGTSLLQELPRKDDVRPVMRRVGRALAILHLGPMVTTRRRPLSREAAIIEKTGELLPLACPHLSAEIEEIVATIIAGLEEVPPAPAHCDFLPAHIVLDGDRLVLLDLDDFAGADPMLDVARLLVPLATAPLRIALARDRARVAAQAFLEEYFAHAPEAWRARLPLYYAIGVLKMALGFYRRQSPGFREKIELLVGEARESLAGERVW